MGYKVSPVTPEDEDAVNEFIRVHFFDNEPLNVAMRQRFNSLNPGTEHSAHCSYSPISNSLSLKAEDEEGNLVGVAINTSPLEGLSVSKTEIKGDRLLMNEILKFLDFIDASHEDVVTKHNSRVLDIKIMAVSSAHQHKGIGALLVSETIKLAESKNLAMTVGCSSHFTSRIMAKFPQFKRILSYPIQNYVNSNQEVVFKVAEPHLNYDVYLYEK